MNKEICIDYRQVEKRISESEKASPGLLYMDGCACIPAEYAERRRNDQLQLVQREHTIIN